MTTSAPPFIECEQIHAGLVVNDIPAAVDFYTQKLGFQLGFTWGEPPTFAGVNLDKVQMFLRMGTRRRYFIRTRGSDRTRKRPSTTFKN